MSFPQERHNVLEGFETPGKFFASHAKHAGVDLLFLPNSLLGAL